MTRAYGMKGTKFYGVWASMISRCNNPSQYGYAHYSKHGIRVCERWMTFRNFYDDMFPAYAEGLTLDRVDTLKGYHPDNCRWVTRREQSRNRRDGLYIETPLGRELLKDLAERTGVRYHTLRKRLKKGLSFPEILEPQK